MSLFVPEAEETAELRITSVDADDSRSLRTNVRRLPLLPDIVERGCASTAFEPGAAEAIAPGDAEAALDPARFDVYALVEEPFEACADPTCVVSPVAEPLADE